MPVNLKLSRNDFGLMPSRRRRKASEAQNNGP